MNYLIENINNIDDIEINAFLKKCSKTELLYFNKLKNKKRKKQAIIGRILLRKILLKEYNIDYFKCKVSYSEYGKPYLKNLDIHFNISHSNELVVCVASKKKVGVDIEKIHPINIKLLDLLTNEEKSYIKYPYRGYNKRFIEIFTLKESYIKLIGSSILNNNNLKILFSNNKMYLNDMSIYFKQIKTEDNYIITFCIKK